MRVLVALFAIAAVAGCGGGIESQVAGTWHVDPASVQTSHLTGAAATNPDWVDAEKELAKLQVQFKTEPKSVSAGGFGQSSSATWKLLGDQILIEGSREAWPTMTFDEKGKRIHLTLDRSGDRVQMDLIKG